MRKRSKEEALKELIEFTKKYKRFPKQNATGYERSLALSISNFKSKNRFNDREKNMIQELEKQYRCVSNKETPEEKFVELIDFIKIANRWPSQKSKNDYERKLYNKTLEKYFLNNDDLLKKYYQLKKQVINNTTPESIILDLQKFVGKNKYFPLENSNDEYEQKLSIQIKIYKNRHKFTSNQLNIINELRKEYRVISGSSSKEQLLFTYLQYQLPYLNIKNREKVFDIEADIYLEVFNRQKIVVFYDGCYHHSKDDVIKKDNDVNRSLINKDVVVYRLREKGCSKLESINSNLVIIELKNNSFINLLDNDFKSFFHLLSNKYHLGEELSYEKNEIIKKSRYEGTPNYNAKKHLITFLRSLIFQEKGIEINSKISYNCKQCISRKRFNDIELIIYRIVKELYSSKKNKSYFIERLKYLLFEYRIMR